MVSIIYASYCFYGKIAYPDRSSVKHIITVKKITKFDLKSK